MNGTQIAALDFCRRILESNYYNWSKCRKNCCRFGKVWKISWKAEQKIRYNAWFLDIYFATLSKRAVIYIHSPINENNNNNGHNDKNNDEQDDDDNDIEIIVHVTRIFFHFVLDKFIYKLTKHREKNPEHFILISK